MCFGSSAGVADVLERTASGPFEDGSVRVVGEPADQGAGPIGDGSESSEVVGVKEEGLAGGKALAGDADTVMQIDHGLSVFDRQHRVGCQAGVPSADSADAVAGVVIREGQRPCRRLNADQATERIKRLLSPRSAGHLPESPVGEVVRASGGETRRRSARLSVSVIADIRLEAQRAGVVVAVGPLWARTRLGFDESIGVVIPVGRAQGGLGACDRGNVPDKVVSEDLRPQHAGRAGELKRVQPTA